jgi:3-isopropylmalate/(R)-2-methylmalate dehydratase small subunit
MSTGPKSTPGGVPRFHVLESTLAPLPIDNIDTDQIIPAEYLKTTVREGIGRGLFAGWRTREGVAAGAEPFVLDDPRYFEAQVLIAGDNFGCGSSREHAPWALLDHGLRAVISTRFADIFRSNALKNGLLPVVMPEDVHQRLMTTAQQDPTARVRIDLETQVLQTPWGDEQPFEVDAFARRCLLEGTDALGYLLGQISAIETWEEAHPARFDTRKPRFTGGPSVHGPSVHGGRS